MEDTVIVGILVGVLVLIAGAVWYLIGDLQAFPETLPECNTLVAGAPLGVHLLFFGSREQVERYWDALRSFAPFSDAKDAFTVSYIADVQPACELYKGIALLCHSRSLIKQAAACEHEYIIVLQEHPPSIRSSAFQNTLSINTNHPVSVIAHEFGHAFGDFAEEYTPADLPPTSENCQASCTSFEKKDGCFQGCSDPGAFRSIQAGVMRTLTASRYGTWHEQYLAGLLTKRTGTTITGYATGPRDCASQSYSLVTLERSAQGLKVIDVAPGQGCGQALTSIDENRFRIFTDVQHDAREVITGETYQYQGTVYAAVASDIATLQLTTNGQVTEEVHLGATFCRA